MAAKIRLATRLERGSWVVGLAISIIAGCGDGDDDTPEGEAPAETSEAPHWTYEGLEGPEHWGELDARFATCASGYEQSPVDIPASIQPAPLSALTFDYAPAPATIVDNGHTVQVNLMAGANELRIGADGYELLQFHFHAHSEHAVQGEYTPLELHLVHRSASGSLAVVGVFLDIGAANVALSPVFDTMASATSQPINLSVELDPSELLPAATDGWTYSGSLTTPPCTEGVKWRLFSSILEVSAAQLERFTSRHEGSYRPVMENDSTITSGD